MPHNGHRARDEQEIKPCGFYVLRLGVLLVTPANVAYPDSFLGLTCEAGTKIFPIEQMIKEAQSRPAGVAQQLSIDL